VQGVYLLQVHGGGQKTKANRESRIVNCESRIANRELPCLWCAISQMLSNILRMCNTGCVNNCLWATLDLPCHFAARIDKEGGVAASGGTGRIANCESPAESRFVCAISQKVRRTAAGEAHFWAEGMK